MVSPETSTVYHLHIHTTFQRIFQLWVVLSGGACVDIVMCVISHTVYCIIVTTTLSLSQHSSYSQYGDGGLFGSYCIWGAGALLGHPNDGLVSISKTDLPYGNPLPHTVGECHSIDMHYPPQCKNKERNAEINSNAAR